MIILESGAEVLKCSCGISFVVNPNEFQVWRSGTSLIKFVNCPSCQTMHSVLYDYTGSEIIEVSEEKKE